MIRHCVLLKFSPETSAQERQTAIEGIRELPEHIPEIDRLL